MNWNAAPTLTIEGFLSSDSADEQIFLGTISNHLSMVSLDVAASHPTFASGIQFILHCGISLSPNFCIQPSLFCRSRCFNNWVSWYCMGKTVDRCMCKIDFVDRYASSSLPECRDVSGNEPD